MFQKAERKQAKLKIALTGVSGSGKTMSALRLAKAMGKRVAVIDTENGSASLYADKFDFDTVNLTPPFSHDKYVAAIEAAERAKYDVIIVDSFSHAWAGEGGTLDRKAGLDARGGNQYGNWRQPKAEYNVLKNAILHSSAHVICTIRSKQAYEVAEEGGKKTPKKIGLDPIAEPGIEYEFTVVFDIASDNSAIASKDRTGLFRTQAAVITEKTGEILMAWLTTAKPDDAAPKAELSADEVHAAAMNEAEDFPHSAPLETLAPTAGARTDLTCLACGDRLIASSSGLGFVCPKRKQGVKGDQHASVPTAKVELYRKKLQTERAQDAAL